MGPSVRMQLDVRLCLGLGLGLVLGLGVCGTGPCLPGARIGVDTIRYQRLEVRLYLGENKPARWTSIYSHMHSRGISIK